MNIVRTELNLVCSRFPGHQPVIEELYKNDADFKTLCTDLLLCSKMMQDFEADILEKQHALKEYGDILKELEKELLMLIEETI